MSFLGVCEWCDSEFESSHKRRWCTNKCRYDQRDRNKMTPCIGGCGKKVWVSGAKCWPCRGVPADGSINHGTRTGYSRGCRCAECKKACADYNREWMRAYKEKTGVTYRRLFADRHSRIPVSKAERQAIYERDGWICQLCDGPVDPSLDHKTATWGATLDHIVPMSLGGGDDVGNLRLAHRWCNSSRGAELVEVSA